MDYNTLSHSSMFKYLFEFNITSVQKFKTDKPCIVCATKNIQNDSYILPCNHTAHVECYGKYLYNKNSTECPICGTISFPRYCTYCNDKQHDYNLCSRLNSKNNDSFVLEKNCLGKSVDFS